MPIVFKDKKDNKLFFSLKPCLRYIALDMEKWLDERGYNLLITRTLDEMLPNSTTNIHADARAFDARSKHLNDKDKEEFVAHFNTKYKSVAAISRGSKLPTLVLLENINEPNEHFHVQIRPKVDYCT